MRIALDTSTRVQSVALESADGSIEVRAQEAPQHSRALVAGIRDLLAAHGASWSDVSCYVVGLGPGSFTGLRVGLSLIKGLAAVHRTPAIGLGSLDAAAFGAGAPAGPQIAAVAYDAKKDLVYAGAFRTAGSGDAVLPVNAYAPDAFAEACLSLGEPVMRLGDGWERYAERMGAEAATARTPCAKALLELARARRLEPGPTAALEPRYVRRSEAEVNWEKRYGPEGGA